MNTKLKQNVAMIVLAHALLLTGPAIVNAKGLDSPVNFTQPIKLERGAISPIGRDAKTFTAENACEAVTKEFGWAQSSCKSIDLLTIGMGPRIDTLLVGMPISDGYVKVDDLLASSAYDDIKAMEDDMRADFVEQSKRAGQKIEFVKWRVFPKADKLRSAVYYAFDLSFDGEISTNIKVMKLDRQGYVPMNVVPVADDLTEAALKMVLDEALDTYTPDTEKSYRAFKDGDKVAVYGGLGLVAASLGVKYGKTAAVVGSGLLAALGKKAGLLLILPFLALGAVFGWIKSLFRRK